MSAPWKLRGYVIDALIGAGGSGEVWRATVAATGEPVALKRIRVDDTVPAGRAEAEAAKLTVLDHPHLVRLHAFVADERSAVLVLDLADAGTLAGLLEARGRLSPGEVITAVAPVAAALAHVHAAGVVHGDVSAANVLFTEGGLPLLADLGVARLTGDFRDAESTPAYVDPLVARGGIPGAPSDVFMLAAVALHALTGAPLWAGNDGAEALAVARGGVLENIESRLRSAGVPPPMAAVLHRALQYDPAHRGTAAELALDLRHSGEPVAIEFAAGRGGTVSPQRSDDAPRVVGEPDPPRRPHAARHAAAPVTRARTPRRSSATSRSRTAVGRLNAIGVHAASDRRVADPARPSDDPARPRFDRPAPARIEPRLPPDSGSRLPPDSGSRLPPTSAISRARPVLPAPGRSRARIAAGSAAVIALVAAVVLGGLFWFDSGKSAPARAVAQQSTAAQAARPATTSTPATATPTELAARHWSGVLHRLDAVRERAFAERDPRLLRQIYAAGPLLEADVTLLHRIVPRGCALLGVRTQFERVVATPAGSAVAVRARTTLPASRLVCAGRVTASAAAVGPVTMSLTLTQRADGPRIVAERLLT